MRAATLGLIASIVVSLSAQTMTVSVGRDALEVRAPGFRFIEGEAAAQLRDGRSLRFDLELTVLAGPGGAALAATRADFNVSYDLWEERFAVVRLGFPSLSISHLTAAQAEAWCLERLAVPLASLARLERRAPFWVHLRYRARDPNRTDAGAGAPISLLGLIERLSRRPPAGEFEGSVESGPFQLSG
jgi:hypothetical protein